MRTIMACGSFQVWAEITSRHKIKPANISPVYDRLNRLKILISKMILQGNLYPHPVWLHKLIFICDLWLIWHIAIDFLCVLSGRACHLICTYPQKVLWFYVDHQRNIYMIITVRIICCTKYVKWQKRTLRNHSRNSSTNAVLYQECMYAH